MKEINLLQKNGPNTHVDHELVELAELAAIVCNMPIALITELRENGIVVSAQKGFEADNAPTCCDFCETNLKEQEDIISVANTLTVPQERDTALVKHNHVRSYTSAPIRSKAGRTFGSICVMDRVEREITAEQTKALRILAKRAAALFTYRDEKVLQENEIRNSAAKLQKLTDYAPGVIFQLEMDNQGGFSFPFVSNGINQINQELTPELLSQNPSHFLAKVHPKSRAKLLKSIKASNETNTDWRCEIRMQHSEGQYEWYVGMAKPEIKEDGTFIWYGTFQNISAQKNYENTLKQIVFDISHVLRKPVTTLMGLTALIQEDELDPENIREYCQYINKVTCELESYTRTLNDNYTKRKLTVLSKIG